MGILTISISDDAEKMFRETVKAELGEGKGKLGKAVEEAMTKWAEEKKAEEYAKEAIAMMKKGLYKVGRNYTFRRFPKTG